jgi:hypothetical protein
MILMTTTLIFTDVKILNLVTEGDFFRYCILDLTLENNYTNYAKILWISDEKMLYLRNENYLTYLCTYNWSVFKETIELTFLIQFDNNLHVIIYKKYK